MCIRDSSLYDLKSIEAAITFGGEYVETAIELLLLAVNRKGKDDLRRVRRSLKSEGWSSNEWGNLSHILVQVSKLVKDATARSLVDDWLKFSRNQEAK